MPFLKMNDLKTNVQYQTQNLIQTIIPRPRCIDILRTKYRSADATIRRFLSATSDNASEHKP